MSPMIRYNHWKSTFYLKTFALEYIQVEGNNTMRALTEVREQAPIGILLKSVWCPDARRVREPRKYRYSHDWQMTQLAVVCNGTCKVASNLHSSGCWRIRKIMITWYGEVTTRNCWLPRVTGVNDPTIHRKWLTYRWPSLIVCVSVFVRRTASTRKRIAAVSKLYARLMNIFWHYLSRVGCSSLFPTFTHGDIASLCNRLSVKLVLKSTHCWSVMDH